jgi:hypothetical protein
MGNSQSFKRINFEDIQYIQTISKDSYLLINTLYDKDQECLIPNTINIQQEEQIINNLLKSGNKSIKILIYGRNCNDESGYKKYTQLASLGFYNIYIYPGGLFEWLSLQDIYGYKEFPTTKKELDLLKYKPSKTLNVAYLQY